MPDRTVIACTVEYIDVSSERWVALDAQPERCQQFPCSQPADRECGLCRSLFCEGHALHDCLRGQRRIDEDGMAI